MPEKVKEKLLLEEEILEFIKQEKKNVKILY